MIKLPSTVKKVYYFSDGAVTQYKNSINIRATMYHMKKKIFGDQKLWQISNNLAKILTLIFFLFREQARCAESAVGVCTVH